MMTEAKIAAGRAVQRALQRAEAAHPNSLALHRLHQRMAELRDAFRSDLSDEQFQAFGGGTPKTPDPDGDG